MADDALNMSALKKNALKKINMTDINDTTNPINLADMLPVGMLANGGMASDAMVAVAQRKHGLAGWEAFHYERISASEFEITGGMAVMVGGMKKWPGPHDTVIVSEVEILQEMQAHQVGEAASGGQTGQNLLLSVPSVSTATSMANTPAQYLKVVLTLPDDEAGRQRVLAAFHLQANVFGARVQTCSLHDKNPTTLD